MRLEPSKRWSCAAPLGETGADGLFMINYEKFELSLKRLDEQHENYQSLDEGLPELTREGIAESVIQRFETCYDCLWKVLKRYLTENLGIAQAPNSPKPLIRLAHENDLFRSSLADWLEYAEARINTSHDYDGEKAKGCLALMPAFIDDAIGLYQTMTGQTWE